MFDAGAVDYAQPSVTKIGGVTEMLRVCELARGRGVKLAPHSPYFGPGLLATVHIAAALEAQTMIEYSYCDLGASPLGDAIRVEGGEIAVPSGPGLGRDPDAGVLARYQVRVVRLLLAAGLVSGFGWAGVSGAAGIAIDVGHYIEAPGAISARGRPEFEFNLDLARAIETVLKSRGHTVRLIGADGKMKDLWRRPGAARGMDLLVSVHHDSVQEKFLSEWTHDGVERRYSDMAAGYSLFVSRENPKLKTSLHCAAAIGSALKDAGFTPSLYHADPVLGENRPFADRENGVHYFDHLAVLRHAALPALLFEAGVIVNREEEIRMSEGQVRGQIAVSVADGIERCLR